MNRSFSLFRTMVAIVALIITVGLPGRFLAAATGTASGEIYAIQHARIVTVTGPVIDNGTVVISNGRISAVGKSVVIPGGAKIIDATGLSVYPGMINAGTSLGLAEIMQVRATVDAGEIDDNNANVHVDVAINPDSEHIRVTRVNGITTVLTEPQGGTISGQSALINLNGWVPKEMILKSPVAMHINWPSAMFFEMGPMPGAPVRTLADARKDQEKQIERLKKLFRDAKAYADAKDACEKDPNLPKRNVDLKLEALIPVVRGKMPMVVHVDAERDIRAAIEFAEVLKVKMILAGAEEAYKLAAQLAEKKIPVIVGPVLTMPFREDDPYDMAFAAAGLLSKAGVKIAFQTLEAIWEVRNLPYQAGVASAFGLPKEEALRAVTIYPAEIFGVADQIGSIEKGKIANLIVTDGDPLEIRTQIKNLFIQGNPIPLTSRHTELYERYKARP